MNTRKDGTPTPSSEPVDLTQPTETTRRALYDAAVETHFTPTPEEQEKAKADPDNHWVPPYTPEQAELAVHHLYGRWFVVWRSLEEEGETLPERRWTVLRVIRDAERGTFEYLEV
jgi:hypothetical protein